MGQGEWLFEIVGFVWLGIVPELVYFLGGKFLSFCLLSSSLWVGNLVSHVEKKCNPRLIKNGTLRKIFGLKRAEVT